MIVSSPHMLVIAWRTRRQACDNSSHALQRRDKWPVHLRWKQFLLFWEVWDFKNRVDIFWWKYWKLNLKIKITFKHYGTVYRCNNQPILLRCSCYMTTKIQTVDRSSNNWIATRGMGKPEWEKCSFFLTFWKKTSKSSFSKAFWSWKLIFKSEFCLNEYCSFPGSLLSGITDLGGLDWSTSV